MSSSVAGPEIERLVQLLARLPGLGPRSARRVGAASHPQARDAARAARRCVARRSGAHPDLFGLRQCRHARSLHDLLGSSGATRRRWSSSRSVGDLWALERAGATRARYHVLGGALSPLDGVGRPISTCPRSSRASPKAAVSEMILAVNATVEGQTTAHYIIDLLADYPIKVTRLAHGVPVGGELDYLDDGTLAAAMRQRTAF